MRKPRNKLSALEIPWYFTISFNLFADKKKRTLNIKLSNADSREHTQTPLCQTKEWFTINKEEKPNCLRS